LQRFQPENAPKAFGDQATPGTARGAYSAPPGPLYLDLRVPGRDKGRDRLAVKTEGERIDGKYGTGRRGGGRGGRGEREGEISPPRVGLCRV